MPASDDLLLRAAASIRQDPSLAALLPLTSAERLQLVDSALEQAWDPPAHAASPSGRLLPFVRRRAPYLAAGAAVALAASAVLLVRSARPEIPALSAYAMKVSGEQEVRGAPHESGERTEVRPETRLSLTLTPAVPERDALVRVLLARGDRAVPLEAPVLRTPSGELVISALATELFGPQADGEVELVVVLGRQLPDDAELVELARGGEVPTHVQLLRHRLRFIGFSHGEVELYLGGCRHVVLDGSSPRGPPRCELAQGAGLRLWLGVASNAEVEVFFDAELQAAPRQISAGGLALELTPGPKVGELVVRTGARELGRWRLAPAPSLPAVAEIDRALAAGEVEAAQQVLMQAGEPVEPVARIELMRRRAKLARRRGSPEEERRARQEAMALAAAHGRISAQLDEAVAIAWGLIDEHALGRAAELLRETAEPARWYAEGAVRRDLAEGLLASELGDLGAALGALRRAITVAERIGDHRDRELALAPLADVLQALGRYDEATVAIDGELARGQLAAQACERVDALTNAGWLLREHAAARARGLAEEAVGLAARQCARLVPIANLNAAWLAAETGDLAGARELVRQLGRALDPDNRVMTWALRLDTELALAEDPARAEERARALERYAGSLCSAELSYEARLLRARALAAGGRVAEAGAAFEAAEQALAQWSRVVPLGEGRAPFFARHDRLAQVALPFWLSLAKSGAPGARLALAAATRRSVARFVHSLAHGGRARVAAERGHWPEQVSTRYQRTLARWPGSLAAAEQALGTAPAAEGCALPAEDFGPSLLEAPRHPALLVHPIPGGLLVLVWRGEVIELAEVPGRVAGEPEDELARRVTQIAAPWLAGADRVQLYLHRSVAGEPIERALFETLHVPVAFAVDATNSPASAPCSGRPRALLVTNPEQNLWHASASAPRLRQRLSAQGYEVVLLDGAAATRAAVLAQLVEPCVALFHYEGHGRAELHGARAGDRSQDALLLADGPLHAAEILELARVPAAAVLHGCTTAAPEGLGLAHAFLLAGGREVIASPYELPAVAAGELSERLFATGRAAAQPDLLEVLQGASRAGGDAGQLRLFTR